MLECRQLWQDEENEASFKTCWLARLRVMGNYGEQGICSGCLRAGGPTTCAPRYSDTDTDPAAHAAADTHATADAHTDPASNIQPAGHD